MSERLRQQVISKVLWGTDDEEVLDWLHEKHGLTGCPAEALLVEAHRARRQAVRHRATLMLIASGLGMLITGVVMIGQLRSGIFFISLVMNLVAGGFAFFVLIFARNFRRLWSGEMPGSVD